jgi:hypothetical protein
MTALLLVVVPKFRTQRKPEPPTDLPESFDGEG